MLSRKMICGVCIIFLVMSVFCWNTPVLDQTLPWSWPPGDPFPIYSQIPYSNWPIQSYFPTAGLSILSGWPPYLPYPGYASAPSIIPASSSGCPVGLVTGLTLDEEFGPGASQLTRCIVFRNSIKVIVRLNHLEYTPGNPITNVLLTMFDDYKITHGSSDFKIAAIIHSAGLPLALNRNAPSPHPEAALNEFQPIIEDLIARGVKFYL